MRIIISTLFLATVAAAPSLSFADGGVELVKYRCDEAQNRVYVGTAVSYEILSDFGKDSIPLVKTLNDKEKHLRCSLSQHANVSVRIHAVPYRSGNNVTVSINDKELGVLKVHPDHEYSYVIKASGDKISIVQSESNIERNVINWDGSANEQSSR
jgi:hypothetical protein